MGLKQQSIVNQDVIIDEQMDLEHVEDVTPRYIRLTSSALYYFFRTNGGIISSVPYVQELLQGFNKFPGRNSYKIHYEGQENILQPPYAYEGPINLIVTDEKIKQFLLDLKRKLPAKLTEYSKQILVTGLNLDKYGILFVKNGNCIF